MTDVKQNIAILTLAIGSDFRKAIEPGLMSKRNYATIHGYTFVEGGVDLWDRTRPIQWSKIRMILRYLDEFDYLFWSDGDVIILNDAVSIEGTLLPHLTPGKDMLWCRDACGNLNNGNVLFRGRSAWVRDFLERCYQQTDLISHIWWDNAAFIRLYYENADDRDRIVTSFDPALFNAYLFSTHNYYDDSVRLYRHGDFLLHLAGVYDPWNILRFMLYIERSRDAGRPINAELLNRWRENPPLNHIQAIEDVENSF
jgi:hypothetical protein